ncbi:MAG: tRNA (adenosine(37)-N6)-threonylcarbamoyltransferase complex transferase subunit TsaD [Firmicutes bacterium]|nr:tRNA (adenosine(37)-N6)-threonylcarbamoyltransferase complex transferase subunit TsaD [Bacillota bacterium]
MNRILGIETSCDETAAAVVEGGNRILSSIVSSQVLLHADFGGVVPEIASRSHLEAITYVIDEALTKAGLAKNGDGIDAIAVTNGPGLIGALMVGLAAAKALSLAWDKPFVAVNHLEGHLYASLLEDANIEMPAIVELVSGGHTLLILMSAPGQYQILGSTVDDAAGEAFDKVARFLHLGYPGGPAIEKIAAEGNDKSVQFPRPMLGQGLDMSFSGLKTAVVNFAKKNPTFPVADIAASFQRCVADVLVSKAVAALELTGAKSICLAGGVGANTLLREELKKAASHLHIKCYLPSKSMCTDNAAMIAAAGYYRLQAGPPSLLNVSAVANLSLSGTFEGN